MIEYANYRTMLANPDFWGIMPWFSVMASVKRYFLLQSTGRPRFEEPSISTERLYGKHHVTSPRPMTFIYHGLECSEMLLWLEVYCSPLMATRTSNSYFPSLRAISHRIWCVAKCAPLGPQVRPLPQCPAWVFNGVASVENYWSSYSVVS